PAPTPPPPPPAPPAPLAPLAPEALVDPMALGEDDEIPDTLTDPITGLFNESFFRVTLDTRVSAARRHLRPVAVVLVQVAPGGLSTRPRSGTRTASRSLRRSDRVAAVGHGPERVLGVQTAEHPARELGPRKRVRRRDAVHHLQHPALEDAVLRPRTREVLD